MKYVVCCIFQKCMTATVALFLFSTIGIASAQQRDVAFPSKPIHFIIPFPGVVENIARAIGEHILSETNQPVVIEPRSGSNGVIASQYITKQPADGYQLLFTTNTTHAGNPAIYSKLSYDSVKDFTPISAVAKGALLYISSASLPVTNMKELVALAKQKPNEISFGWAGSSGRAAGEMLNISSNIKLRDVPYKASPQALTDLLGGHIDLMAHADIAAGIELGRTGKVKVLGISTLERLESYPNIPTLKEQGFADFEMVYWIAVYAPAGTPSAVVLRLNALISSAMKTDRVKALVKNYGMVAYVTSPEGLATFQAAETEKWRRIVIAAGMQQTQ